jgi:hypothetical protein
MAALLAVKVWQTRRRMHNESSGHRKPSDFRLLRGQQDNRQCPKKEIVMPRNRSNPVPTRRRPPHPNLGQLRKRWKRNEVNGTAYR